VTRFQNLFPVVLACLQDRDSWRPGPGVHAPPLSLNSSSKTPDPSAAGAPYELDAR